MLKTNTISLRALEPEDLDLLYTIENDPALSPYSTHNGPHSKYMLQQYITQQHQTIYEQNQQRLVITDVSKKVLGLVDLFDFEPKSKRAGVGVVVLEDYRNKGVATQALELLEHYVRDHYALHMLHADVLSSNTASCRLFEKRNFVAIGIKRHWYFFQNQYHDVRCYQKLFST